ncbi:MAG: TIGR02680 family protein, partial [Mycobacteriaceae bacterium]
MIGRFKPTRAGIINLWDYRDQEFSFADGRLVLRGPNGSGKTKALEVLYPFVLDGRIEPRRLNPFAGEERTMKSNLLYRDQESAHSYVWMEFSRGEISHPEAVTVGIGMRAAKHNDKVSRWYFVAEGRVGIDFSLFGSDDRPLTKKQLAEQIGPDSLTDRPVDYRMAIDARLFGLGLERYEQLINLVLTLRRPQLAKNLDPKGLSQALTDGLRPLDASLLTDAARSFSDMEEVGRALEGLARADRGAQDFINVYTKYLAAHAHAAVEQVGRRLKSVEALAATLAEAAQTRERATSEQHKCQTALAEAEKILEQSRADLEMLQRSSAYEGKQQLDQLSELVGAVEKSADKHAEQARTAQSTLAQRTEEATKATNNYHTILQTVMRAESDLATAAEDAGIMWTALPESVRPDQITTAVRGHAEERDGALRIVRKALADVDSAAAERERAEKAADRVQEQLVSGQSAITAAQTEVEIARKSVSSEVRRWWVDHQTIYRELNLGVELIEQLEQTIASIDVTDPESTSLAEVLIKETTTTLDAVRSTEQQAKISRKMRVDQIDALKSEYSSIASETDDAPQFLLQRSENISSVGAPLWQLVRFKDGIDEQQAAGIEAALEASNILDAWVGNNTGIKDGSTDLRIEPLPEEQRPAGPTLRDVLVAEESPDVTEADINAILSSISLQRTDSQSEKNVLTINSTGKFSFGIRIGAHHKKSAEFIGATARKKRRTTRLAEINDQINELTQDNEVAEKLIKQCTNLQSAVKRAAEKLPKLGPIYTAMNKVTDAGGVLRTRAEAVGHAQTELDLAISNLTTKEKNLLSTAVRQQTPHKVRDLDALAAAVRHFESQGELVVRSRRELAKAKEHADEAQDRLYEARGNAEEFAEEATLARARFEQEAHKLSALRAAVGASVEQIDNEIAKARNAIDSHRTSLRIVQKANEKAIAQAGKAEGSYEGAIAALKTALQESQTDAKLLAPYARKDILQILGITENLSWPQASGAWQDADQLLYRITRAPESFTGIEVLPDDVAYLHAALNAATLSTSGSEAVRKTTRSALTSALQELDIQLSSTGQDYRLQWDSPDEITVVQVQDSDGYFSIHEFAERIKSAHNDQELLLTASERLILEDALLTGLAQQIHERTVEARELISQMGTEMRQRKMSSGNTIGVHWTISDALDDGGRAICKILDRDVTALDADELATLRSHFAAQIRLARAAHPERSYPEILSTTLDYRRWRVF